MLRLTVISQTEEESILKVEGSVSGADVALLEEEGSRLLGASERLVLELKGVNFIDREGISLLKLWSRSRLELREASMFLHTLLKEHGLA
jgi:anti-anti-sigma regulatory factor